MNSRRDIRNYETSSHSSSSLNLFLPSFNQLNNQKYYLKFQQLFKQFIPIIFAVFINLLDAVTFGTCFFPLVLGKTSSLAIDLFLFSTFIIQIILIFMSSFQYGLGTSMAENIPFIHTMALGVYESMKLSYSVEEMMPTILITVCISTILNGLAFYLVGYFRLGYILHFFPRHVILGMTFGFGIFLLLTSLQVTTGIMPDSNIFINIITMGWNNFIQFSLVCILEIFLRIVSIFEFGETAGPIIMFIIPLFFYFILWLNNISLDQAREANWLFPVAESSHGWDMWDHFSFVDVQWGIVLLQLPTILSLGAFTLLLVPIRIPTLSMITGDDVDFDSELKAQGLGNIFSGILGSVHNYLSYSNSVFYYNIGGGGKISQFVIAILTGILFLVGPQIINIVPRIIAGVIMLHLAFDLLNDSALASRRALDSLEYTSVILVGLIVTIFGFVPGIVAGGVSACVTFVVQSSKGSNVRGVFTGEVVRSNTAWTGKRRDKLEQGLARHGVYVIQLQGHIFFGNIQQVVNSIETIIQEGYKRDSPNGIAMGSGTTPNVSPKSFYSPSYRKNYLSTESDPSIPQLDIPSPPLVGGLSSIESNSPDPAPEYVVLDCSFVSGLDGNAVEGFLKLQKRLQAEDYIPNPIFLTFAGLQSSLQDMFAVHQAEFARRAINNIQSNLNDQRSSTEPTERSRLLSISSDEENGLRSYRSNEDEHSNIFHNENGVENENDIHNDNNQNQINNYNNQNYENNDNINNCNNNSNNKQQQLLLLSLQSNQINNEQYQGNQIQSQLNGNVASEIIKRKRKPPKYRRMKSEPPNTQFHSDVNTALQVVEEHIIDSIDSPRASPTMSHRLLDTSQPNSSISSDPYHRFESLDEADPYVTSIINSSIQKSVSFESNDQSNADSITSSSSLIIPPNNLNINSIINSTSSTTVAHPLVPSLNLNTRRRSRSQPYDDTSYYLGSSFIPPTSTSTNSCIIPPSMTMVSPLKDISRSKRIFSPTENFLPMTIGMSHGVSGMVTNQSKPPSGQSSPRSTLLDLAKETQRIPSESFPINPNIILNENLKIRKSSSQSNLPTLTHSLSIEIPEDPIIPLNNYNYNINSNVNENTNGNGNYNGSQSNKPDEMQRLLRRLLYELSSDLGDQDVTVLKKLADYFRRDIRTVDVGECLWCARDPAVQMGFLISGRMEAMLGNQKEKRTLQIILPGTFMGELGLLSGKIHSRTIVATQKSQVAILTKETLSHIQKEDINLLCTLQKLALRTAAIRSTQLMLFSAGSLGPK